MMPSSSCILNRIGVTWPEAVVQLQQAILLLVSFGLPFRLGIIIDIFVRMNEQPNRLLSFR